MGIRRGRPGCATGGRDRRRLRRHGARRQPAGCRRPRSRMVPSYPASRVDPTAAPKATSACLTAPTPWWTPCAPAATRSSWVRLPCATTTRGCSCARRLAATRAPPVGSRQRRSRSPACATRSVEGRPSVPCAADAARDLASRISSGLWRDPARPTVRRSCVVAAAFAPPGWSRCRRGFRPADRRSELALHRRELRG